MRRGIFWIFLDNEIFYFKLNNIVKNNNEECFNNKRIPCWIISVEMERARFSWTCAWAKQKHLVLSWHPYLNKAFNLIKYILKYIKRKEAYWVRQDCMNELASEDNEGRLTIPRICDKINVSVMYSWATRTNGSPLAIS